MVKEKQLKFLVTKDTHKNFQKTCIDSDVSMQKALELFVEAVSMTSGTVITDLRELTKKKAG